jgi:hypothetical protein
MAKRAALSFLGDDARQLASTAAPDAPDDEADLAELDRLAPGWREGKLSAAEMAKLKEYLGADDDADVLQILKDLRETEAEEKAGAPGAAAASVYRASLPDEKAAPPIQRRMPENEAEWREWERSLSPRDLELLDRLDTELGRSGGQDEDTRRQLDELIWRTMPGFWKKRQEEDRLDEPLGSEEYRRRERRLGPEGVPIVPGEEDLLTPRDKLPEGGGDPAPEEETDIARAPQRSHWLAAAASTPADDKPDEPPPADDTRRFPATGAERVLEGDYGEDRPPPELPEEDGIESHLRERYRLRELASAHGFLNELAPVETANGDETAPDPEMAAAGRGEAARSTHSSEGKARHAAPANDLAARLREVMSDPKLRARIRQGLRLHRGDSALAEQVEDLLAEAARQPDGDEVSGLGRAPAIVEFDRERRWNSERGIVLYSLLAEATHRAFRKKFQRDMTPDEQGVADEQISRRLRQYGIPYGADGFGDDWGGIGEASEAPRKIADVDALTERLIQKYGAR